MHASTKQFGRGRATGLVLIALVALGLGYLHFSGGSDPVSVPVRRPRRSADPREPVRTRTSLPIAARSSSAKTGTTPTRA